MVRNNVGALANDLFSKHEMRCRGKEKDFFIERIKQAFREIGYSDDDMMIQKSFMGGKNLVVGSPHAEFLFTAHYDTPARNGYLALPFIKTLGLGWSSLLGVLFMVILLAPGILLPILNIFGINFMNHYVVNIIPWVVFMATSAALFLIKNPHNHNDNTSGCLGVYNVATIVSGNPVLRAKCAFVLFDREELGLLGSSAFAEWQGKNYSGSVINIDCIGVGETLAVSAPQKAMALKAGLAQFLEEEGFETQQKNSSLLGYASDHMNFKNGVMLSFLRRSRLGGLYIPNIHSSKDTECDLERIERLSAAVCKYVEEN